jgi:hypothetical protein
MSTTTEITRRPDTYALGHTPGEYERLRAQARDWEAATARILGQISLPADASCHAGRACPGHRPVRQQPGAVAADDRRLEAQGTGLTTSTALQRQHRDNMLLRLAT